MVYDRFIYFILFKHLMMLKQLTQPGIFQWNYEILLLEYNLANFFLFYVFGV